MIVERPGRLSTMPVPVANMWGYAEQTRDVCDPPA
jgi:hypothetical protein